VKKPVYVTSPNASFYKNLKITIMGWGRFGGNAAAARFLAGQGARITVTDKKPLEAFSALPEDLPCEWVLGRHREEDFINADVVLVNPAVTPNSPFLRKAIEAGIPLDTEINLFLRLCPTRRIVAVTGSNGKSTTTSLLSAMLIEKGLRVHCGGNVGRSLLGSLNQIQEDHVVALELSSFQIQRMTEAGLGVWGAVLLNLEPNHLDWHGSWEAYREAKAGLLKTVDPQGWTVLHGGRPSVAQLGGCSRGPVYHFAVKTGLSWVDRGSVWCRFDEREHEICGAGEILLRGPHNLENVAAAAAAAGLAGADPDSVRRATLAFLPLPHRLEVCGEKEGILWINDSVSTTPESTIMALRSFPGRIHLFLGGKDKGLCPKELIREAAKRSHRIYLLGAVARILEEALLQEGFDPGRLGMYVALEESVASAAQFACPGDVVLFSPGFSSYDMFLNFEERGDRFKRAVLSHLGHRSAKSSR